MLTLAPLPTWAHLGRALIRRPPDAAELVTPWRRPGDLAGWLSRSAWSLALIASWRRQRAPERPVTAWIPDFFCNATLAPLRQAGVRLRFYPLAEDLTPDLDAFDRMSDSEPLDLFLLVHYFGRPVATGAARDLCVRHRAWLIEDAAHVLCPVEGIGQAGDFVVYSPHKHLPLPDGAVLVARGGGPGELGAAGLASLGAPALWHQQLVRLAHEMGCSAGTDRIRQIVWFGKRALQKLGLGSWRPSATVFDEPVNQDRPVPPSLERPVPSGLGRRMLATLQLSGDLGAAARLRNQRLWDGRVGIDRDSRAMLSAARPTRGEWTPYLASYESEPAVAAAVYERWRRRGWPVLTWPDLPPEVTAARDRHAAAWRLRHSRLYLPVHTSLTIPPTVHPIGRP